jgi:hypothetical protein
MKRRDDEPDRDGKRVRARWLDAKEEQQSQGGEAQHGDDAEASHAEVPRAMCGHFVPPIVNRPRAIGTVKESNKKMQMKMKMRA